jgi:hypothetical protein
MTELSAKPNTQFSDSSPLRAPDQKLSAAPKNLKAPAIIPPFGFLLHQNPDQNTVRLLSLHGPDFTFDLSSYAGSRQFVFSTHF